MWNMLKVFILQMDQTFFLGVLLFFLFFIIIFVRKIYVLKLKDWFRFKRRGTIADFIFQNIYKTLKIFLFFNGFIFFLRYSLEFLDFLYLDQIVYGIEIFHHIFNIVIVYLIIYKINDVFYQIVKKWHFTKKIIQETKIDSIFIELFEGVSKVFISAFSAILILNIFSFSIQVEKVATKLIYIIIIMSVTRMMVDIIYLIEKFIISKNPSTQENRFKTRAIMTQLTVYKKIALVFIAVFSISSVFMLFDGMRQFGTSILASAGVIGVIIGFATQKTIANLFAGFLIALTQPIRLDDVVIVEGEWGIIEEITLTHVIVRIWDSRRLVVPVSYFNDQPFQNWTRSSSDLMGTAFFHADYSVDIEKLREELIRICENSDFWDKRFCGISVTNAKEHVLELRALVTAENADKLWDLRCEVREKLIVYIQKNMPEALPRMRLESLSKESEKG